ncbi:hypothetical protein HO173_006466 [Letharia columbiana]|uniref:Uncharacterized protein n=1 Tax=Letharia columbiana TaxID=112416 RepID=A0A8H6FV04_9LECA|nr:uncharacterized protein HO173_006466 [Letharia columbiana]KAF6235272.1 hypothetical protein HO173_006466 [Letharia columbiana]
MILQTLPLFALIATCFTLSIPLEASAVRLPLHLQNETIPSSPANATNAGLGTWPDTPFNRHLGWDTGIEIISCTPASPADPTSEMGVLEGISIIGAKARSQSRLALIENFHEDSGPVTFDFHATEDLFRGSDVGKILDVLWEMTNQYGKGGVYGCLVMEDIHTAYFNLALKKVAVAK